MVRKDAWNWCLLLEVAYVLHKYSLPDEWQFMQALSAFFLNHTLGPVARDTKKAPPQRDPLYNVASSCSAPCSSRVISVMVCSGVTTGAAPFSKVSTSAS